MAETAIAIAIATDLNLVAAAVDPSVGIGVRAWRWASLTSNKSVNESPSWALRLRWRFDTAGVDSIRMWRDALALDHVRWTGCASSPNDAILGNSAAALTPLCAPGQTVRPRVWLNLRWSTPTGQCWSPGEASGRIVDV